MKAVTMAYPRQHHGRRGFLLLQTAIVMASIHFANAAPFSGSLPSKLTTVPVMGGQGLTINDNDHLLPPKFPISSQRKRRWILSKITSLRGGSSPNRSRGTVGGAGGAISDAGSVDSSVFDNNPKDLNHSPEKNDVSKGGSIHPSSIISTVLLIITESLNVASAAIVLSGYFGAWVASWMVGKLHNVLPTLTKNGVISGGGSGESNNLLLGKYRLTTLASIAILLLHTTGFQSNNIYSRMSDASFVAILWIYSHLVNPILGGMIGCTHVSLGVISTILENPKLASALEQLGDVRLKKLGQYGEEDDPYISPSEDRIPRVPIVTSKPRNEMTASIANMMGSASLLIAFPQYCLGLYLLGSTLVSWSSSKQFDGGWKRFEKWMQWLSEGICVSYDENGKLECDIDAAIGDAMNERIDPWKLSKRLVALYWVIALAKMTFYIIV